MTDCAFPSCTRPLWKAGYCAAHYQQKHRGEELRPARTVRGDGTKLQVRMSWELRLLVQAAAADLGVDEPEWVRRAIKYVLDKEASPGGTKQGGGILGE